VMLTKKAAAINRSQRSWKQGPFQPSADFPALQG
jgi:hypothetical protein